MSDPRLRRWGAERCEKGPCQSSLLSSFGMSSLSTILMYKRQSVTIVWDRRCQKASRREGDVGVQGVMPISPAKSVPRTRLQDGAAVDRLLGCLIA